MRGYDIALSARADKLIKGIREKNITFCAGSNKLEHLTKALIFCRDNIGEGIYIEAGVAMGGTAMLIALLKRPDSKLKLFDVFRLLPPPDPMNDGSKAMTVYNMFESGHMSDATSMNYLKNINDMLPFVQSNFIEFGLEPAAYQVEFIKGLFVDTMFINEPVAFCHVDCDWYGPASYCIDQVKDNVVSGGLVVFDDYHSFDGCKKAVDEWLASDVRYRIVSKEWSIVVQRMI